VHHPGVNLSESLIKSNPRVSDRTCWHAAIYTAGSDTMATQGRVPLKLWAM